MKTHILGTIACYLYSQLVYPASFDCDKASGFVEKSICSSASLSTLDDKLSNAYSKAIDEADDPASVKKTQIQWLRNNRNRCNSPECLDRAYKQRIEEIVKFDKYSWKTYTDKTLGISLDYPSNRTVKVDNKYKRVNITGPSLIGASYYISFELSQGDFKKAIRNTEIFERQNGKWVAIIGPGNNEAADMIAGNGWKGIKTIISCGVSDKETGIHATGECLWAILSDGKRYAVANTQGMVEIDNRIIKTIMSFHFL
jgi:uncharacterized protein